MELSDTIGIMHKGKLVNVEARSNTNAARVFSEMVRELEPEGMKA
jgi:ABC-type sugar transport system ATPase subunit